jgi:hypothetical protein
VIPGWSKIQYGYGISSYSIFTLAYSHSVASFTVVVVVVVVVAILLQDSCVKVSKKE